MRVIHKFPLRRARVQDIFIPKDAVILTVQVQRGVPCLWVLLDPNANDTSLREIVIIGTGQEFPENGLKYIGTFQLHDSSLIFHVFEHKEESDENLRRDS